MRKSRENPLNRHPFGLLLPLPPSQHPPISRHARFLLHLWPARQIHQASRPFLLWSLLLLFHLPPFLDLCRQALPRPGSLADGKPPSRSNTSARSPSITLSQADMYAWLMGCLGSPGGPDSSGDALDGSMGQLDQGGPMDGLELDVVLQGVYVHRDRHCTVRLDSSYSNFISLSLRSYNIDQT
jgi:hypothetical protein